MATIPKVPYIPEAQRTSVVVALLEIIQFQNEQIQALKNEIARLKGQKSKPEIKPSQLEKDPVSNETTGQRPGSAKRSKTGEIHIHETKWSNP